MPALNADQFPDSSYTVECEHCGRPVPFAQTSEGMCETCTDRPISDAQRKRWRN